MMFDQLNYFMAVYKEKSFSIAAVKLSISQSALSKQIKNLEDELDIQLFDRQHRRMIVPTYAGDEFAIYAKQMIDLNKNMLLKMKKHSKLEKGTVTLATIPVLSQFSLSSALIDFISSHPLIDVHFFEIENDFIVKQIKDNSIDLAILREEFLPDDLTNNYLLAEDHLVLVVDKHHPLAKEPCVDLADLDSIEFISLVPESGLFQLITDECEKVGFTPRIRMTNTRIETILSLLRESEYATLMMEKSVRPFIDEEFVIIPLKQTIKSRLVLAELRHNTLSPAAESLKEYILNLE
ncbi:LysR family transcriptional regulator [Vagococcus sp. DIV0080]|uniref:LysR family transcriptional regulator n=1 Tax=Candidatus Vagococcus giribetii TaxID=2230876 RepID=A0ABS3HRA2_9ENTE|nr:LysR family transcriptional regulator [Vagococcus sp. DIV0080]MBO0476156.1 LysR family transcriptional regulator [Vagococcus sp. DIV0080]